MITIFNRKELILTYKMKEQGDVRMILSQNKIPYKITTRNIGDAHSFRGHTGVLGLNTDLLYEYRIYVHKDDYDRAVVLINQNK
ncbi:MAG: hypothetical protein IJ024_08150 [Lachnospiraceae bacterium]|nr:hypothetical protein [Lachnospiraceae bacterium]